MRQELQDINPMQKFPDRLGGDHPSVTYTAQERREIIAGIAGDCYISMGHSIRDNEYSDVVRVWCELFDEIPDTRLEDVRREGLRRAARTPQEFVAVHDEWAIVAAKKANTKRVIAQYEAHDQAARESGGLGPVMGPGKTHAFNVFRELGIIPQGAAA